MIGSKYGANILKKFGVVSTVQRHSLCSVTGVGLDSASAFYCMKALRTIVMEGRTVFMSIHQPSSEVYDLFDQLLLLSKGRMVYFGPASGYGPYQ